MALIQWMPASIRLLSYFSNFILLATFLGIGCNSVQLCSFVHQSSRRTNPRDVASGANAVERNVGSVLATVERRLLRLLARRCLRGTDEGSAAPDAW